MNRTFIAYFSHDEETNTYFGTIPGIDGAHTQADTLEDLMEMLKEVAEIRLEDMDIEDKKFLPVREGMLQVQVAV